jgi:hypothetical protein
MRNFGPLAWQIRAVLCCIHYEARFVPVSEDDASDSESNQWAVELPLQISNWRLEIPTMTSFDNVLAVALALPEASPNELRARHPCGSCEGISFPR